MADEGQFFDRRIEDPFEGITVSGSDPRTETVEIDRREPTEEIVSPSGCVDCETKETHEEISGPSVSTDTDSTAEAAFKRGACKRLQEFLSPLFRLIGLGEINGCVMLMILLFAGAVVINRDIFGGSNG